MGDVVVAQQHNESVVLVGVTSVFTLLIVILPIATLIAAVESYTVRLSQRWKKVGTGVVLLCFINVYCSGRWLFTGWADEEGEPSCWWVSCSHLKTIHLSSCWTVMMFATKMVSAAFSG